MFELHQLSPYDSFFLFPSLHPFSYLPFQMNIHFLSIHLNINPSSFFPFSLFRSDLILFALLLHQLLSCCNYPSRRHLSFLSFLIFHTTSFFLHFLPFCSLFVVYMFVFVLYLIPLSIVPKLPQISHRSRYFPFVSFRSSSSILQ